MKTFKFAFLFLALFSFATSCEDDDDGTTVCNQSDWAGTYAGTVNCDGFEQEATVTITANGTDNIVIVYEAIDSSTNTTSTTTFDPLPFDGCNLDASASGSGFTVEVDARLNGNELTIAQVTADSTDTFTCNIVATRN